MTPQQIGQFFGGLLGVCPTRTGFVAVFTAYFDESGHHDDRAFTMAVLVAPATRWEPFCLAWERAMERSGAKGKTLHMKHVLQGTKGKREDEDWRGWDEPKRERLFRRLVPPLHAHATWIFACTVPIKDFDKEMRAPAIPVTEQINPTVWCLVKCLEGIKFKTSASASDPVACVFHQNEETEADMHRHFLLLRRAREGWGDIFPTIAFAPAQGFPPIQAADMVAHENFDHWMDQRIAPTGKRPRALYEQLVRPPRSVSRFFDLQFLRGERAVMDNLLSTMPQAEYDELQADYRKAHIQMNQERDPRFPQKRQGPKP